MPNDYEVAHKARKNPLKRSPVLPQSDRKTITPDYLLNHENHFDPDIYTPEQMNQNLGTFEGSKPVVKS